MNRRRADDRILGRFWIKSTKQLLRAPAAVDWVEPRQGKAHRDCLGTDHGCSGSSVGLTPSSSSFDLPYESVAPSRARRSRSPLAKRLADAYHLIYRRVVPISRHPVQ